MMNVLVHIALHIVTYRNFGMIGALMGVIGSLTGQHEAVYEQAFDIVSFEYSISLTPVKPELGSLFKPLPRNINVRPMVVARH